MSTTTSGAQWLRQHRSELLLVAVVLVLSGGVVQVRMAHQASRLAFSAAIWEENSIQVDSYVHILGVDYAERDGHVYSDKAPGQPLLTAPFYGVGRLLGMDSAAAGEVWDNRILWWTSLWAAAVPLALIAVMFRRFVLQLFDDPRVATGTALVVTFGTLLFPFSTVLFGHVMAAALGFGCYLAAREPGAPPVRLAAAGLLGGLAVVTEYTTGIVVVVVGILTLLRHRWDTVYYIAGGLPMVVVLGLYNKAAWGGYTEFSYSHSASFASFHEQGLFGIRLPDFWLTLQVLFGERGLFTLTPVVLVGVAGLIWISTERRHAEVGRTGLAVFAAFVAVQGGWYSVTAGASPGPRYVVAALPFIAAGVARIWQWKPAVPVVAGMVGAITMGFAWATNPLAPQRERFAVGHWIWRMGEGRWVHTVFQPFFPAPYSLLILLAIAAGLVWVLWRTAVAETPAAKRNRAVLPKADK